MKIKPVIFFATLWFFCSSCPSVRAEQYRGYFRLGPEVGLPNTAITGLYQDEFEFVWIATQDGLFRFDGTNIKSFRTSNSDIFSNNIKSICGDGHGTVYVISKFALGCLDLKTEHFRTIVENGIISQYYGKNNLWVASQSTLYKLTRDSLNVFYEVAPTYGRITEVFESTGEQIILGTASSLLSIDKNGKMNELLSGIDVQKIFEDSRKNLWIGTRDKGVYIIHSDRNISHYEYSDDADALCSNYVNAICEDMFGNIVLGTLAGLNIFNTSMAKMKSAFLHENRQAIENQSVFCLMRDKQNTTWIGSFGSVILHNPERDVFKYHDKLFLNPRTHVYNAVVEDPKSGYLYFCSEETGIIRYDAKKDEYLPLPDDNHETSNILSLLFDDENGVLWAGSKLGGLLKIDRTGRIISTYLHHEYDSTSIPDNNGRRLFKYGDSLIIATNIGASVLDLVTDTFSPLSDSPLIRNKYITDMYLDRNANCWIAMSDGVFVHNMTSGQESAYFFKDKGLLKTNRVIDFFEDSRGSLWIGTSGSGLLKFDYTTQSFNAFTTTNSAIESDYILAIAESKSGYLILTTNTGLVLFDTDNNQFSIYNRQNGFPISGFLPKGLFTSSRDDIYVIGVNDIVSFKEGNLPKTGTPKPIYFTNLRVNNAAVPIGDENSILAQSLLFQHDITLSHRESNISVTASSPDFISRGHIQYMLEGFDSEWIDAQIGNDIIYTNLEPKQYTLRVRSTASGDGGPQESNLGIRVRPAVYATLFAKLLYLFLLTGIALALLRIYVNRMKLTASLENEKKEKQSLQEMAQAKMAFFTYISHEIRTPVSIIQSQVDTILHRASVPPKDYHDMQSIDRNLGKIKSLIDELLDFRKQESGVEKIVFSKQEICPIVQRVINVFKEYADNLGIRLSYKCSVDEKTKIWINGQKIEKALYNLLSNAIKHTPRGGHIDCRFEEGEENVTVKIKNDGKMIPRAYLQSIFLPFFQLPDNGEVNGTGLGLSITKGIIDAHKGTISCESDEKNGTVFAFSLLKGEEHLDEQLKESISGLEPTEIPDAFPTYGDAQDLVQTKSFDFGEEQPTILIVEDNDDLREHLKSVFEPCYKTITASDGMEAWRLIQKRLPDIILSDLMMPNLDGNELCTKVKGNFATCHIPFIIITAKVSGEAEFDSLLRGTDDYITKPFSTRILVTKCNNLIKNRENLRQLFTKDVNYFASILATNDSDRKFIEKASFIVSENINNSDFGINQLADALNLGRTNLFNKIKGMTGQTPNKFITTIRIKYAAKQLLSSPNLSVSEISYLTGFNSPSYFIKVFKSYFGQTPSDFRESKVETEQ